MNYFQHIYIKLFYNYEAQVIQKNIPTIIWGPINSMMVAMVKAIINIKNNTSLGFLSSLSP